MTQLNFQDPRLLSFDIFKSKWKFQVRVLRPKNIFMAAKMQNLGTKFEVQDVGI